jgi:hypothetical protein
LSVEAPYHAGLGVTGGEAACVPQVSTRYRLTDSFTLWHTLIIRDITQGQSGQLDFVFVDGIPGIFSIYLLVIISIRSEFIFCMHSLLCILISDCR